MSVHLWSYLRVLCMSCSSVVVLTLIFVSIPLWLCLLSYICICSSVVVIQFSYTRVCVSEPLWSYYLPLSIQGLLPLPLRACVLLSGPPLLYYIELSLRNQVVPCRPFPVFLYLRCWVPEQCAPLTVVESGIGLLALVWSLSTQEKEIICFLGVDFSCRSFSSESGFSSGSAMCLCCVYLTKWFVCRVLELVLGWSQWMIIQTPQVIQFPRHSVVFVYL